MPPLLHPPSWFSIALLTLACGASYWAGDHNRNNAWLAKQGLAQRQAKEALQAAQARGDTLSNTLLASEQQINQLKTENAHALALATTGRPCFNSATLRLLKQSPGLRLDELPKAPGRAAASDAAPAALGGDAAGPTAGVAAGVAAEFATGFSSDAQVAGWAVDAAAQYEVCRARLGALIEWHTP